MIKKLLLLILPTITAIAGFAQLSPQPAKNSPYATVTEIPVENVFLAEGFWNDLFEKVRNTTIPKMFEYMHTDTSSHWRNFLIAAGEMEGKWKGTFWHDGDFYKWLEAVALVYEITGDKELDRLMDQVIEVISKVQAADGYISTFIQLQNLERFRNKSHHELYNLGHLMTAAARHYEATGKTSLLNVGIKTADYLYETFAVNRPPRLNPFGFNPSNIMGAIDIYRVTGNKNYLALADTFVSMRGTTKLGVTITREEFMEHNTPPGEDQNQDRIPFRKETEAVGHAVTALYLYSGAADVFLETGEKALLETNLRLWDDIVHRKMAVHGGMGPVPHGLSIRRDKTHEAFDAPYILPLRVSYNETCANIGSIMWNWRMFLARPSVSYLDAMETGLYNSGLSGFGLDGFSFFYNNPLRRYGKEAGLHGNNETFERTNYIRSYCCPPQLARHLAGFRRYIYAVSQNKPEVWVNFFVAGSARLTLNTGETVNVMQQTKYPWDGKVTISISSEKKTPFTLMLPVPGWAQGAKAFLNGKPISGVTEGEFIALERQWEQGDKVVIELPMRVRLIKANPLVEQTLNQVAIARGPIVYCLESVDLPDDVHFTEVMFKRKSKFTTEHIPDLLGGVTVINTKALVVNDPDWSKKRYNSPYLYKETGNEKTREAAIRLIPYYVWSNRGLSEMTIWVPFVR